MAAGDIEGTCILRGMANFLRALCVSARVAAAFGMNSSGVGGRNDRVGRCADAFGGGTLGTDGLGGSRERRS